MPRMSRAARGLALYSFALLVLASAGTAEKRRAFATSTAWTGDIQNWPGATGGTVLDKADSVCRTLAADADPEPLPHANTYRAWLSIIGTDAYCHVQGLTGTRLNDCNHVAQPGAGPWYIANGTATFTASLDELVDDGVIFRAVTRDENNATLPADSGGRTYWTGTTADGKSSTSDCSGWSSPASNLSGTIGDGRAGAVQWTQFGNAFCDSSRRLLCVEPGASETTPLAWQPSAIVFLSSETGSGDLETWPSAGGFSGVNAAYQVCESLAEAAHLPDPGSFAPWLSTLAIDARDRITTDGPFRRVDGYAVASDFDDLTNGAIDNGIYVDENGAYLFDPASRFAWTGSDASGFWTGETCSLWDDGTAAANGTTGLAPIGTVADWTDNVDRSCSASQHLYCISNTVTLFWDGFELTGDPSRWSNTAP